MSASTTLTLGSSMLTSNDNLRESQFYEISDHANSNSQKHISSYYYYPQTSVDPDTDFVINFDDNTFHNNADGSAPPPLEEIPPLKRTKEDNGASSSIVPRRLTKSNSFNDFQFERLKPTILKHYSLSATNATIATSFTVNDTSALNSREVFTSSEVTANNNDESEPTDEHALLAAQSARSNSSLDNSSNSRRSMRSTRSTIANNKARNSFCYRAYGFINRNRYLGYLVVLSLVLALMVFTFIMRDYGKELLYWIEKQNPWIIFGVVMFLFVVVSFPVVVGYFLLLITAGYLFGCLKGFLTVILGANMGIAIAHLTIRSFRHRLPMHRLVKSETGRAILRVISGPKAFKVVIFTRLTPIPFGVQNAIFGVSSINPIVYHTATFLGLLPAQTINVYLGSTLRSMQEVLNNHGTAFTGYISFGVEVVCGAALMLWVITKARKELSDTLLSDIRTEDKFNEIEV